MNIDLLFFFFFFWLVAVVARQTKGSRYKYMYKQFPCAHVRLLCKHIPFVDAVSIYLPLPVILEP